VAGGVDVVQALYGRDPAYISSVKIPAINAAVLAACDAQDGIQTGSSTTHAVPLRPAVSSVRM